MTLRVVNRACREPRIMKGDRNGVAGKETDSSRHSQGQDSRSRCQVKGQGPSRRWAGNADGSALETHAHPSELDEKRRARTAVATDGRIRRYRDILGALHA